jgi:hypothetical protein
MEKSGRENNKDIIVYTRFDKGIDQQVIERANCLKISKAAMVRLLVQEGLRYSTVGKS